MPVEISLLFGWTTPKCTLPLNSATVCKNNLKVINNTLSSTRGRFVRNQQRITCKVSLRTFQSKELLIISKQRLHDGSYECQSLQILGPARSWKARTTKKTGTWLLQHLGLRDGLYKGLFPISSKDYKTNSVGKVELRHVIGWWRIRHVTLWGAT